ncbi:hypothetical protein D3C85_1656780 [compost metagenome]
MSSLDYFNRGITRALARRKKQQSNQHTKADGDVTTITNTIANTGKCSNVITTTKLTDEQYQITIIEMMVNLIHKQKDKTNE